MKSTVLDPGGQSKTKFRKLDNNLPVNSVLFILVNNFTKRRYGPELARKGSKFT
jgi:hypothetical protein